jgi:hypothetical protein
MTYPRSLSLNGTSWGEGGVDSKAFVQDSMGFRISSGS